KNIEAMGNAMAKGGPDGAGIDDGGIAGVMFGHRRLALLDLSESGHQPMRDFDEGYVLTFNGEIYNYLSLKEELTDYPFKSGTDTEVIIAGYAKWGTSVFGKLRGMFAFALLDKVTNTVYLVRDPSGIKPLYYSHTSGRTVFASEIRAFKATDYDYQENPDWRVYFLAFGHIPEPFTTLRDVQALPKGKYGEISLDTKSFTLHKYHSSLNEQVMIDDKDHSQTMIANQLKTAVSDHLLADAKIGVFLSGGIDSSIVTLIADEKLKKGLQTISVNFEESGFSEKAFQDIIVDRVSSTHSTHLITNKLFEENFETILAAVDQPSNDCINSWFVSKYAKESGLKAVLSGIGADEIFGGY
ncbi:MAG: asparagine synthase (glutamine-hydrolyzing), partial [Pedobacter sp.]